MVAPEASAPKGPELHWAAATITDFGTYVDGGFTGGIAVAGKPAATAIGHTQLRTGLLLAAGVLTLAAAVLAHLIAGLAVRPAVRGLEAQEQFFIDASHELRTPLATLRVLTERRAPPEQTLRQIDRITQLTERLLTRAKTSSTIVVATEPIRLDRVVERAVIAHVEAAERHARSGDASQADIDLVTEPSVVKADPELVEQIVENALRNAARYGAPPVRVRAEAGVLEITDHGPGIPRRDRRRVLRAGSTAGRGTGTGLAIVQWAADAQRADLALRDTRPDRNHPGLTITVHFRTPRTSTSSKSHAAGQIVDADRHEGA